MVQGPSGGDNIRQAPGLEEETPKATKSVQEEEAVVEQRDCGPVGRGM